MNLYGPLEIGKMMLKALLSMHFAENVLLTLLH